MKQLTTFISAFLFLIVGVSQVWALPACPSSGYFHNCYGTYVWDDGDKYVGDWQNDKKDGQGTYYYLADNEFKGDKHVGEYKDGKWNGQGTYTYGPNSEWVGDTYVGEFKDDMMHGQGTYTFADGSKDVGTFENDKLNGYAITYHADGSINQEGIFKDDKFLYAQKKSKIDKLKDICKEIGYTPKTEKFADCVLELMRKD